MPRRILVTGATGFLGSRIVEALVQLEGVQVVATGRTLKPDASVSLPQVSYLLGDLTQPEFVQELFENGEVSEVIHAAALSSPWGTEEAFHLSNVVATQLLIEQAKARGVSKFVFISTPSLYFALKDQLEVTEDMPLPRPINAYARTKRAAELEVMASGIPYVIFRPRALIGRGDTVIMPRLIRAQAEGKLRRMGQGRNVVDLTPVANAVDAVLLGLDAQGDALNQVYNLSNGAPVMLWPTMDAVFQDLKLDPLQRSVAGWVVLAVARGMEWHAKWFNGNLEPALTVYGVGTLIKSFSLDITKAKRLLNYVPRQSVEEALAEFVEWHEKRKA